MLYSFKYQLLNDLLEPDPSDRQLLSVAINETNNSWAPYSGYRVGAAVQLINGEIIGSNNQENIAFPSGMCAERIALYYASSKFPGIPVTAIAITASSDQFIINGPVTPCGACRQVMLEIRSKQKENIRVVCYGMKGNVLIIEDVNHLLPFSFKADELKK